MRTRTARYGHRAEVKEDANRHNSRSATHPQVARQLDEADNQEAMMNDVEIECLYCDEILPAGMPEGSICAACYEQVNDYSFGECPVCGEPIDYCMGGHVYEYEED